MIESQAQTFETSVSPETKLIPWLISDEIKYEINNTLAFPNYGTSQTTTYGDISVIC